MHPWLLQNTKVCTKRTKVCTARGTALPTSRSSQTLICCLSASSSERYAQKLKECGHWASPYGTRLLFPACRCRRRPP